MESLRKRFTAPDTEGVLQEAVALLRAGEKAEARDLLQRVVEIEPDNEAAWRLLARCAGSRAERVHALRRVVTIDPANTRAKRILASMEEPAWRTLWELRYHRFFRPVAIGAVVLLLLAFMLPLVLGALRESHRTNLEAAVRTSEAHKAEAIQTATARSWFIPTWTPAATTRTPSPTNTLVVPDDPATGIGDSATWATPSPGCCP